jgi:hypothetical protein
MKASEHQEQVAYFDWVRLMENSDSRYSMIFAIPNGGRRDTSTAVKLKREGVKAGVSDVFVAIPSRGYHGAFLELKTKTGRVRDSQKVFIAAAAEQGYFTEVVRGFDEIKEITEWYLGSDE